MRAYYPNVFNRLADVASICLLIMALSVCPIATKAQTPAAATPSAVKGTIQSCPSTLWMDRQIHKCKIVLGNDADIKLATDALNLLNQVVKSPEFKNAVSAANFDQGHMKQCQSINKCGPQLTKEKVYDLMLTNSPQAINVIYYLHHKPDEGNQGFEDPKPPNTVFGNRDAINGSASFLASLMLHEWMHILGFRHDDQKRVDACRSVPYEMNLVYNNVAGQLHLPVPANPCDATKQ